MIKIQDDDFILVKMITETAQRQAGSWMALSRALGIGKTTVYAWKYNISVPSIQQFLTLLHYLGVVPYVIKGLEEAEKAQSILGSLHRSPARKNSIRARLQQSSSEPVHRGPAQPRRARNVRLQ